MTSEREEDGPRGSKKGPHWGVGFKLRSSVTNSSEEGRLHFLNVQTSLYLQKRLPEEAPSGQKRN